ncbi:MAG: hypothetical protein WKF81_05925 [Thermomicrobiales bacterium]
MTTHHFPGAVGLTHLRVYTSTSLDGLVGGSPHLHLASAEAYVPTRGLGEAHTFSREGFTTQKLEPGRVVWFEPGVVHRLVNTSGDLEILAIMQNMGLPEAGDAVFTFPMAVMADANAYAKAAELPSGDEASRLLSAERRRDLATQGFAELVQSDDPERHLDMLYRLAIARRQHLFGQWSDLLKAGTETASADARHRLNALTGGVIDKLKVARLSASDGESGDHPGVGMCGRLQQYHPKIE